MSNLHRVLGMGTNMKNIKNRRRKGFTLFECVVGIALLSIAVLGLAQMFMLSVMNNARSDRITNAVFLTQQQIDILRNLTVAEITQLRDAAQGIDLNGDTIIDISKDELLDLNGDGINDYRRITEVQNPSGGASWEVKVLVFTAEQFDKLRSDLLGNPQNYAVKAKIETVISR
jgi:prepilin-type N-terminal cleavage/methylation domain-containing protein